MGSDKIKLVLDAAARNTTLESLDISGMEVNSKIHHNIPNVYFSRQFYDGRRSGSSSRAIEDKYNTVYYKYTTYI